MEIQKSASVMPSPAVSSSSDRTSLTADYEMFLKMLTTQMTNQDPLNPVDSSDYATQLATFSSVEQQIKTNELLSSLAEKIGGTGLSDLANWIGREVRSTAPAQFSGHAITVTTDLPESADNAVLSVRDESGATIQEFQLDVGRSSVEWPVTQDIASIPQGLYTFHIEARNGEDVVSSFQTSSYGRILEAQKDDNGTVLVLEGDARISAAEVSGVRQ